MQGHFGSIVDSIGNTPVVQLRHLVRPGMARVLVKLEGANPTGSKKDRMAQGVIVSARARGALRPGQAVVEYSGGSTGTSLALICQAYGHPLLIVTSDAFSQEKRDFMVALGAQVEVLPSEDRKITRALIQSMVRRASDIAEQEGAYWTDQFQNPDATAGYDSLAAELVAQIGDIDAFADCIGTAHGIAGVSKGLRNRGSRARIIGIEPAESAVLSGGTPGAHRIEGMGAGFEVPAWKEAQVDALETVTSEEAMETARALAAREGIFAGTSTGANVAVALRVAERLGEGKTVVTLAIDHGMKYLSTELYRRDSA